MHTRAFVIHLTMITTHASSYRSRVKRLYVCVNLETSIRVRAEITRLQRRSASHSTLQHNPPVAHRTHCLTYIFKRKGGQQQAVLLLAMPRCFLDETRNRPLGQWPRSCCSTNVASGPSVWTGRALQAENDDLEKSVLRFCIRPIDGAFELLAIMDIRARSISFASRPRRPYGRAT
jgi:hypothetical protein